MDPHTDARTHTHTSPFTHVSTLGFQSKLLAVCLWASNTRVRHLNQTGSQQKPLTLSSVKKTNQNNYTTKNKTIKLLQFLTSVLTQRSASVCDPGQLKGNPQTHAAQLTHWSLFYQTSSSASAGTIKRNYTDGKKNNIYIYIYIFFF